jgi:two-component system LytT family response regulator
VEEVDYVEAASNYAILNTAGGNHVVRETLLNLEAKLPPKQFRRISRSVIVNLERIREIHADANGDQVVVLHSDRQLSLTRNAHEIMNCLQFPEAPSTSPNG